MCGIFGISINHNSRLDADTCKLILTDLFLLSESRGKEASGFALNNGKSVKIFKAPVPAGETIKTSTYKVNITEHFKNFEDFACAIGHSRLVTNGYEQFNQNNQPVIKNGLIGVHNGIIVNESALWKKFGKDQKLSDLDSELIPVILKNYRDAGVTLKNSVKNLFREIYGMTTIAFLFADLQNLLLATNNGSLYYRVSSDNNAFIFASERYILETLANKTKINLFFQADEIHQLKAGSMLLLNLSSLDFESTLIDNNPDSSDFSNVSTTEFPLEIQDISSVETPPDIYINTSLQHQDVKVDAFLHDHLANCNERISKLKRCSKCLLPETFTYIEFDKDGVCNYCRNYKKIEFEGPGKFREVLDTVRSKDGKPDCLLPFSGGRDSCYALHYVKKELGLNPIAFSYDWGMITDLARRNQSRLCGKLGVEHILVSADIRRKRANIRKNVLAWLKRPSLGTIPLFMAGDKQYFYYSNLLMQQNNLKISILGENMLETTNFKSGFCGIKPVFGPRNTYSLSVTNKMRMLSFYGKQFLLNPAYLNTSLWDSLKAFRSYYLLDHNTINIFNYLPWDENIIVNTLIQEYDWETDPGTPATWRIGDGPAAFYNYIYYVVAGFTENDTFRSNQVREGMLTRPEAMKIVNKENQARFDSIKWYCDTIQIDFNQTLKSINGIIKLY